jgi:hypothetical protein
MHADVQEATQWQKGEPGNEIPELSDQTQVSVATLPAWESCCGTPGGGLCAL